MLGVSSSGRGVCVRIHCTVGWLLAAILAAACGSGSSTPELDAGGRDAATHDSGVDGRTSHDAKDAGPAAETGSDSGLLPGEYCAGGIPTIRFDPPLVVVAAGTFRPVKAIVEPDICSPTPLTFASTNAALVPIPPSATLDVTHASYDFLVYGGPPDAGANASGMATVTASMPSGTDGGAPSTATLPVYVNNGALPTCAVGDVASGTLSGTATVLSGTGGLGAAALSVPPGAFTRTDEWALPSFPGTVACANDDLTVSKMANGSGSKGHAPAPGGLISIGPAVTFTAGSPINMTQSLRRELDFSIPINPAAVPTYARLRHLQVLYMSPGSNGITAAPIVMTIANPLVTQTASGSFVLP